MCIQNRARPSDARRSVFIWSSFHPGLNLNSFVLTLLLLMSAVRPALAEKLLYSGTNHCYERLPMTTNWFTARDQCSALGGNLVTLTSQGENDFVNVNLVQSATGSAWLGATDEVQEGVWRWVTGEAWSYTNWRSGEPNNQFDEDYVIFDLTPIGWSDGDSGSGLSSICEWSNLQEVCDGIDNDCDATVDENCPPAPVSRWKADGDASDTVGSNHGTLMGGAGFAMGVSNQAFSFDGTDDHVALGDVLNTVRIPFTVEGWIKPTRGSATLISTDGGGPYDGFWFQLDSSNHSLLSYGDGSGCQSAACQRSKASTAAIPLNQWSHIVAVVRGPALIDLFLNGVDAGGSLSGSGGPMIHGTASAFIGQYAPGSSLFSGLIDDLRVHNEALSEDVILSRYQAVVPPPVMGTHGLRAQFYGPLSASGLSSTVANRFPALNPRAFVVYQPSGAVSTTAYVVPTINFQAAFGNFAFYNVGDNGAVDSGSTLQSPHGDDLGFLAPGGNNDRFGVAFTGFLDIPTSGNVTFGIQVDDFATLVVNGVQRLSGGGSVTVPGLGPGLVPISLYYGENGGTTKIVLTASGGGLPGGPVPSTFLLPAITSERYCNDVDDNGDGVIDEGCDDDGDDHCDGSMTVFGHPAACPLGGGDCDDRVDTVYDSAPEICDRVDNQCAGNPGFGLVDRNDPGLIQSDTDGDGLWDCWEVYGIDVDGNGTVDLPLDRPPYNADRRKRDLFVEVDHMAAPDHTHEARLGALEAVSTAFSSRATASSGHVQPITIHWILDETIAEDAANIDMETITEHNMLQYGAACAANDQGPGCYPDPVVVCDAGSTGHFGSPSDRSSPNCSAIIRAKSYVFRYMAMVHDVAGGWHGLTRQIEPGKASSNGILIARLRSDFVHVVDDLFDGVYAGEANDKQAGTVMHELGHSLGLQHGGAYDVRCKPNYLSVMNYSRTWNHLGRAQFLPGVLNGFPVRTDRELNYSAAALPALQEAALNESQGVSTDLGGRILYGSNGSARVGPAHGPVDWNVNGLTENPVPTYLDINKIDSIDGCSSGQNDSDGSLGGFQDWDRVFSGLRLPDAPLPALLTRPFESLGLPGGGDFGDEATQDDYLNGSLGSSDYDADGVPNPIDRCPLDPDPSQLNADDDSRGDACDCAMSDPSIWDLPSEAEDLRFADAHTLVWHAPEVPGSTQLRYDTIRSSSPTTFSTGACIESAGSDLETTDMTAPSLGQSYFYLVRAANTCPGRYGPLGYSSTGVLHTGPNCP